MLSNLGYVVCFCLNKNRIDLSRFYSGFSQSSGKIQSWFLNLCDYNDYLWSNNGREFNIERAQNVCRMYVQIFIIIITELPLLVVEAEDPENRKLQTLLYEHC